MYHESIVEHYENPRNVGSLDKNDASVGTVRYSLFRACPSREEFCGARRNASSRSFAVYHISLSLLNVVLSSHARFTNLISLQGLVGAPACGDVMKLQIKVDDEGRIVESKFKTFGCGSAIASSSVATEWVKGKTVDDVLQIRNSDIAAHLKLPPVKLHCSMLAEDAIKAAVSDWKAKQAQSKQAKQQAQAAA
jgi:nitrogen fixation NifU-like protein